MKVCKWALIYFSISILGCSSSIEEMKCDISVDFVSEYEGKLVEKGVGVPHVAHIVFNKVGDSGDVSLYAKDAKCTLDSSCGSAPKKYTKTLGPNTINLTYSRESRVSVDDVKLHVDRETLELKGESKFVLTPSRGFTGGQVNSVYVGTCEVLKKGYNA